MRCSTEYAVIAIRSKTSDYLKPFYLATSNQVKTFFATALSITLAELAVWLEGYCISGAKGTNFACPLMLDDLLIHSPAGIVNSYKQSLLQLKSTTAALILSKLCKFCFLWDYHSLSYQSYQVLLPKSKCHACTIWILRKILLQSMALSSTGGLSRNFVICWTSQLEMKSFSWSMHGRMTQHNSLNWVTRRWRNGWTRELKQHLTR